RGEEALRLAEAVVQPTSMILVLNFVGLCYRRQGMLQKAIPLLERGLALAQSADIPLQFPMTGLPLECGVCPGRARGGGPAAPRPDAEASGGVPAVLEQKTTICCKYLYLLASLKDAPCLGGAYEDKSQRCGRKPCSWVKYYDKCGQ